MVKEWRVTLAEMVLMAGIWLVLVGGAVLLAQTNLRLHHGEWLQLDVYTAARWLGASLPEVGWRGVQNAINWILDAPLAGVMIAVGLSSVLLGVVAGTREENSNGSAHRPM